MFADIGLFPQWQALDTVHKESLHVLVEGAVTGQLGLMSCQFEVEVVDSDGDDDDEAQDEPQHQGQGLLQPLTLVCDALIRCNRRKGYHS